MNTIEHPRDSADRRVGVSANQVLRSDTPWLMTAAGTCFPLLDPKPSDTDARHRAIMLAKRPRFGGATRGFYSVAQHAVLVSQIVDELLAANDDGVGGMVLAPAPAFYGLLHDDHEAYLGDMPTPVKHALRAIDERAIAAWNRLVDGIDRAVHESHGLPWPRDPRIDAMVRQADLLALATEKRDLMPHPAPGHPDWDIPLPHALDHVKIVPLNPDQAQFAYLQRLTDLEARRRAAAE